MITNFRGQKILGSFTLYLMIPISVAPQLAQTHSFHPQWRSLYLLLKVLQSKYIQYRFKSTGVRKIDLFEVD